MNKRRKGHLYDVTPTLSCRPQVNLVLRANCRMQGPDDEANCDLLTHMVTSQINKGFSNCSGRSQKVEDSWTFGSCNLCAAPCSSCFHASKVLMKSTGESAAETCEENGVVDQGKQCEALQLSEMSTVAGMNSTSYSVSGDALGKASERISDASISDDNVVRPKVEGRQVLEGRDDFFLCVSGTDEFAYKKSDIGDIRISYGRKSKISGEISDKVPPNSSPISPSKSTDNATELQYTSSHATNEKNMLHKDSEDVEDDKPSDTKSKPLEGSTELLNSLPTTELASGVACGDPSAPDRNRIEKNDSTEIEIQPIDETDDSDMVEQDVKVCDICGDAGQEDLLAICCHCSDGAEHTYCMREMLDKVPEGDWMCEECKSMERVGSERPEKIGRVDENEKNNSSGQASSEYVNSSDIEGQRNKGYMKFRGKRRRDDTDAEVSSIVKKPSLDSIIRSPNTSSPSKTAALSSEDSLKNIDKGRLQSSHHSSLDTIPVNDTPESARPASNLRVQKFRGTFSKSNSFNSLNSKPKVKLVDQGVLQRQISAREHASFPLKDGVPRSIGKSLSFKSTNSSCSETKMKAISPRLSHIQDVKNTKQRSLFERKSSFKMEHLSINSLAGTSGSSMPRIDKRTASGVESSFLTAISNHHEVKPVQADVKSAAIPRPSSLAARRNADLSSPLGEFKRPSLHGRISTSNGANNTEQKSRLKEEDASCSPVAERTPFSEGLPDGRSRSRDFATSGELKREYSGNRLRPSSLNSLRDEGDILKAAIEAAVLRKPGVYRKQRALGQSDNSSASTVGYEIPSCQDHMSNSAGKKNLSSVAEPSERHTVSQHLKGDFLKQESLNKADLSPYPVEGLPSGGEVAAPIVPLDGKSSFRESFINVPAAMPSFLKSLAIPEHEYIWQGSFEICRSGKIFDSWDGIQAHLSTCASRKVVEAVNKFKSRIILYEVPRLSTWPMQFQEHGVREENIALFFFAKDLESYDKIYKLLLDNMMKNDLALKGNFNGVELLIFPSSQLPDDSQRWNMLFFLWGVFRGKRKSCLQRMPESIEQYNAPRDMPPAILSLPENRCSLSPIGNNLPASEHAAPEPKVRAAEELCSLLSSRTVKGDCSTKVSSLDQPDNGLNSSSSVAVQSDTAKQCQEQRDTCLEGCIISSCRPPLQAANSTESSGREQMMMPFCTLLDRQQSTHHFSNSAAGNHDVEVIGHRTILETRTHNEEVVKSKMDAEDLSTNGDMPLKKDPDTKYPNMEHNRWLLNAKERLHTESCVVSRGTSPVQPGNSGDAREESSRALEEMNHVVTGSCVVENLGHEARHETDISEYNENAERHLFPVEIRPAVGADLSDRSMPWRMHISEQNRLHDRGPNLELALGAEIKPLTQTNRPLLDKKTNEEHIFPEAGIKAEDDASASLSLSLSFPFK